VVELGCQANRTRTFAEVTVPAAELIATADEATATNVEPIATDADLIATSARVIAHVDEAHCHPRGTNWNCSQAAAATAVA
jgi:hypothetical protein